MPESAVDIQDVLDLLPHRYPFLLIDRVEDLVPGESATGVKCVSANEPYFQGHFPSRPIMPGVLVLEAMAQTSAVLVGRTLGLCPDRTDVYFCAVDKARFRKPVVPGDVLELRIRTLRVRQRIWRFVGAATVSGAQVAESEFAVMYALKPE